jgi:hypothetical protein
LAFFVAVFVYAGGMLKNGFQGKQINRLQRKHFFRDLIRTTFGSTPTQIYPSRTLAKGLWHNPAYMYTTERDRQRDRETGRERVK